MQYQKKIAAIEAEGQDAVNEETFTEEELQQLNDAKSVQNLLDSKPPVHAEFDLYESECV